VARLDAVDRARRRAGVIELAVALRDRLEDLKGKFRSFAPNLHRNDLCGCLILGLFFNLCLYNITYPTPPQQPLTKRSGQYECLTAEVRTLGHNASPRLARLRLSAAQCAAIRKACTSGLWMARPTSFDTVPDLRRRAIAAARRIGFELPWALGIPAGGSLLQQRPRTPTIGRGGASGRHAMSPAARNEVDELRTLLAAVVDLEAWVVRFTRGVVAACDVLDVARSAVPLQPRNSPAAATHDATARRDLAPDASPRPRSSPDWFVRAASLESFSVEAWSGAEPGRLGALAQDASSHAFAALASMRSPFDRHPPLNCGSGGGGNAARVSPLSVASFSGSPSVRRPQTFESAPTAEAVAARRAHAPPLHAPSVRGVTETRGTSSRGARRR
jgi:hypothetical protein